MREYMMTLMTVSVICGVIGVLSPKEDMGKYLSLVCGICALGIIVAPITELIKKADELPDMLGYESGSYDEEFYEKTFEDSIVEGSINQAESILENNLSGELDIDRESFDITLSVERVQSVLRVKRATVTIYPKGLTIDARSVIEYIEKNLGCSCMIIYE
jgi:hypothetical protein